MLQPWHYLAENLFYTRILGSAWVEIEVTFNTLLTKQAQKKSSEPELPLSGTLYLTC